MKAVILIPWRPGGNERRMQLWDWTQPFLEEIGWPIFTGDDGGEPFSRAAAVNAASENAGDWDVALIGDADTVQEVGPAHLAANWAYAEGIAVVPWTTRHKLSAVGTLAFVQRGPDEFNQGWIDRRDRTSPNGGGATIVVSRKAWETVGGFDEGFRGYGNEDLGFVAAIETLVLGEGRTVPKQDGTVWHLWHQPQPGVGTLTAAVPPNRERWEMYKRAWNNPGMMRILLKGPRP